MAMLLAFWGVIDGYGISLSHDMGFVWLGLYHMICYMAGDMSHGMSHGWRYVTWLGSYHMPAMVCYRSTGLTCYRHFNQIL